MADLIYELPKNPPYEEKIRALKDSDPNRATTIFNPLFKTIISNIHHVKLTEVSLEEKVEEIEKAVAQAARASQAYKATVPATGWTKGAAGADGSYWYQCNVDFSQIKATDIVLIFPADKAAEAVIKECIRTFVDTFGGGFRVYANTRPTQAINIIFTISTQEG